MAAGGRKAGENLKAAFYFLFVRQLRTIIALDKRGQNDLPPFLKSSKRHMSWYIAAQTRGGCPGHDGSAAIPGNIDIQRDVLIQPIHIWRGNIGRVGIWYVLFGYKKFAIFSSFFIRVIANTPV